MLIDKDDLIIFLLERYYKIILMCGDEEEDEYKRGYIKGVIDTIEEVNKFQGLDR